MSDFERDDTEPAEGPFGALIAFLSDLDEQVQMFRKESGGDEFTVKLLDELQARIVGMALIVAIKSRT